MRTKKLTYWVAINLSDRIYNVRAKTKKELKQKMDQMKLDPLDQEYDTPYKTTVEYLNTLDLLDMALGEASCVD